MKKMFIDLINDFKECKEKFKGEPHKWLPNIFTVARIGLIPVVIGLIATGNFLSGSIMAGITAGTDGIDGFLARRLNAGSEFGRKLDTIADKLLAATLGICLVFNSPIFLLPISLEAAIAGVNLYAEKKNKKPKTNQLGRLKTVILDIALVAGIANLQMKSITSLVYLLIGGTVISQAHALKEYVINAKSDKNNLKIKNVEIKDNNTIEDQSIKKDYQPSKEEYLEMMYPKKQDVEQKIYTKQKDRH